MQLQKSLLTATLLLAVSSLTVANAAPPAAITTDQFKVLLQVDSVCAIETGAAADINLGAIGAGEAQLVPGSVTGTTTITTRCSVGSSAIIALTPVSGNTDGTGVLLGGVAGAEKVKYQLTSTAGLAGTAWGNTGANRVTTAAATNYATPITTTVYATVTDTADVKPGAYEDTVTINITL
ncbi:spore coat protein U domain-containing protein [Psychrobacter urativorans]|uniref:spore coat protein U domain-containing protein n=1 Tax=Psychrobacter urativorans TaxID=45610 RepID=UPI001917BE88|nr:spore coat protein U domain-containing protein [Psychrobacter urativorans]